MSKRRSLLDAHLRHVGDAGVVARTRVLCGPPLHAEDHQFMLDHRAEFTFAELLQWLAHAWPGESDEERGVASTWDSTRAAVVTLAAERFPGSDDEQTNALFLDFAPMASCFRDRDWAQLMKEFHARVDGDECRASAMLRWGTMNRNARASATPAEHPAAPHAELQRPKTKITDLAAEITGLSRQIEMEWSSFFQFEFERIAADDSTIDGLRAFALSVIDRVGVPYFIFLTTWLAAHGVSRTSLVPRALTRHAALPHFTYHSCRIEDLIANLMDSRSAWEADGPEVITRLFATDPGAVLRVLMGISRRIATADPAAVGGKLACAVRAAVVRALIPLAEAAISARDDGRAVRIADAIATIETPGRLVPDLRRLAQCPGASAEFTEVINGCVALRAKEKGERTPISDLANAMVVLVGGHGLTIAPVRHA